MPDQRWSPQLKDKGCDNVLRGQSCYTGDSEGWMCSNSRMISKQKPVSLYAQQILRGMNLRIFLIIILKFKLTFQASIKEHGKDRHTTIYKCINLHVLALDLLMSQDHLLTTLTVTFIISPFCIWWWWRGYAVLHEITDFWDLILCSVVKRGSLYHKWWLMHSETIFCSFGGVINKVESTWLENFQGGEAGQPGAWLCADQIAK